MTRHATVLLLCLAAVALAGCAPSFTLPLPERFVVLEDEDRDPTAGYVQRATTPDGVVVGLRALDHRVEGTLAFWSEAVIRQLRDHRGYAVLGEEEIRAASGQPGRLYRLGRDLDGHAYRYTVAVFVTDDHIWVADAGGREEPFAALEPQVEQAFASLEL
ncbi:MAG TPA: serine/threonine protein kinase [Sandaracinaceae bacterium LLY-WYZ-13_1]|nr:serine/threonine protein kinase [Sandaracinaceae bacterium LLY-WYZ-13_1]